MIIRSLYRLKKILWYGVVVICLLFSVVANSKETKAESFSYAKLSLEELQILKMNPMQMQKAELSSQSVQQYWEEHGVTSASKKGEDPFDAPSAIYVINQEHIKRSGATNIPDLLRMAPGLQVAQIDANKWAVTARGGNRQFTGQLLVLIDGRNIYSPIFSGVFWDIHSPILEDIDRVEIIRGPGAAVWGNNAVNGVINIITKKSGDTQRKHFSVLFGNKEKGTGQISIGDKISSTTTYRMYAKKLKTGNSYDMSGKALPNSRDNIHGGIRIDHKTKSGSQVMFQTNSYHVNSKGYTLFHPILESPFSKEVIAGKESYGGNMISKYKFDSKYTSTELNASLNYDIMDYSTLIKREDYAIDIDLQQTLHHLKKHTIIWGVGFSLVEDKTESSSLLGYEPEDKVSHNYTAFLQDEFVIIPRILHSTIGARLEYTEFTNFEYQPSARIAWYPYENQTVWGAVSRVVRIPTRFERGGYQIIEGTGDGFIALLGNEAFDSEKLLSYELGYRIKPVRGLQIDIAAFHNRYNNFGVFSVEEPYDNIFVPLKLESTGDATINGVEVAMEWQLYSNLKLDISYSFLDAEFNADKNSVVVNHDNDPKHQFSLRSLWNINKTLKWDNQVNYVDTLHKVDINSYTRWDTRFGWKLSGNTEIDFVFQNILDDKHQEFISSLNAKPSQIGRSFYTKLTWEF